MWLALRSARLRRGSAEPCPGLVGVPCLYNADEGQRFPEGPCERTPTSFLCWASFKACPAKCCSAGDRFDAIGRGVACHSFHRHSGDGTGPSVGEIVNVPACEIVQVVDPARPFPRARGARASPQYAFRARIPECRPQALLHSRRRAGRNGVRRLADRSPAPADRAASGRNRSD